MSAGIAQPAAVTVGVVMEDARTTAHTPPLSTSERAQATHRTWAPPNMPMYPPPRTDRPTRTLLLAASSGNTVSGDWSVTAAAASRMMPAAAFTRCVTRDARSGF